jgi:hypothetical protein
LKLLDALKPSMHFLPEGMSFYRNAFKHGDSSAAKKLCLLELGFYDLNVKEASNGSTFT